MLQTRRNIALFVLAAALVTAAAPTAAAADPPGLPPEAEAAIDARDWPRALTLLAEPLKDPKNLTARYWAGIALLRQGKAGDAIAHFAAAFAGDPTDLLAAQRLAEAARIAGKPLDFPGSGLGGIRTLRPNPVAARFPDDPIIVLEVGRAWMDIYNGSRNAGNAIDRGYARTAFEQMGKYLPRAPLLAPESIEAHEWAAAYHMLNKNHAMAARHAARATRLGPVAQETYAILGESLAALGRHEEAVEARAAALRAANAAEQPAARRLLGVALAQAGRPHDAVPHLRASLAADPAQYHVRRELGEAAQAAGDHRLALWAFAESRAADKDRSAVPAAARSLYELGQYAQAAQLFDEARKTNARASHTDYYHGLTLWKLGNKTEAIDLLIAAAKETNNRTIARVLLDAAFEADDPFAAAEACRALGNAGAADEAIEGVAAIRSRWFFPQADPRKRYKERHHTFTLAIAAAIYYNDGRFKDASRAYSALSHISMAAAWSHAHAGLESKAADVFNRLAQQQAPIHIGRGLTGAAYLHLRAGRFQEARQTAQKVTHPPYFANRDTILLWSAAQTGNAAQLDQANGWSVLGVIDDGFEGSGAVFGVGVRALLAGSPLAAATPAIRPFDRIVSVNDVRLGSLPTAKRTPPLPAGPMRIVVARGDDIFEITIDPAQVLADLRKASKPAAVPQVQP